MLNDLHSISKIAKNNNLDTKEMFDVFASNGLITRQANSWVLTSKGTKMGGRTLHSAKYGEYPAFPPAIIDTLIDRPIEAKLVSATKIGEVLNISSQNINAVMSELGWIKKGEVKGWTTTTYGAQLGAVSKIHDKSGVPFVLWPESILENPSFKDSVKQFKGESSDIEEVDVEIVENFREKFRANHRAQDGHFVRSRAELIIDNWLYMAEISHAYERKLPIPETAYCDFYLPGGKVYIEFWGMENDDKYRSRKQEKIALYHKYEFRLIELRDNDVYNIDDVLPGLLLRHDIKSY